MKKPAAAPTIRFSCMPESRPRSATSPNRAAPSAPAMTSPPRVHQGYAESHRDQAEIDRDDPAVGRRIGHRVGQRVGARRNNAQDRQRIQDLEPAADARRISGGAELEKTGDRMLQAAAHG